MDKVPVHVCNKRVIESLIKAGAFDEMKHKRRALVTIHEMAVDQYIDIKKNEAIGQDSLFGGLDEADGGFGVNVAIPDIDDWDKMTLLGHEREMLGLYVSDHPLLGLEHVLQAGTDCTIGQLMLDEERPHGSTLTISGLVTSVQRKITKKGDSWATVTLEDLDGAIEVLLFPSAYQLASSHLVEDAIIRVKGQLSRDKDQPELRAQEVTVPDLSDGPSGPVTVNLPQTRINPGVVDSLKEVLATHPGVTEVLLNVRMRDKTIVLQGRGPPPRDAVPGAVRRPEAAARAGVPVGMTDRLGAAVQALLFLAVFALSGALAGVVWERLWSPPAGVAFEDKWFLEPAGPDFSFSGTGWYVVVALVAGAVTAFALALVVAAARADQPGRDRRRLDAGRLGDVQGRPCAGPARTRSCSPRASRTSPPSRAT